jgi:hypothetical protein
LRIFFNLGDGVSCLRNARRPDHGTVYRTGLMIVGILSRTFLDSISNS